jgi:predicted dehydrogenase
LKKAQVIAPQQAHDLDYIRWVLNDEVKSVYATGSSSVKKLEEVGVHDNATMLMTFMKGRHTLFRKKGQSIDSLTK